MNKEEIEKQLKLSKRQNKYERYDYLCSEFNGIDYCIKLEKYTNKLQQQNKKYKEVIDKLKEWEQTHTILVYTKEAPRQLVGTHELLHLLYDEDKEVQ